MLTAMMMVLLPLEKAQASERQYKIEAAFLYNFFNYIHWPDVPAAGDAPPPQICVMAGDPIVPYLQYVQRKMQAEKPFGIRETTPAEGIEGCQMLYQRFDGKSPLWEHAHESQTLIVTISDQPQGIGMINLFEQQGRLAMHINHTHMAELGYEVSSRLLALAEHVQ